ncbi:MAG: hypothetical protein GX237_02805 [Clostridiales bacterium]|nr:hypothetical protein [Clostridiales bacterium]
MNKNMKRTIILCLIYSLGIGGLSLLVGTLIPFNYVHYIKGNDSQGSEILKTDQDINDNLNLEANDESASISSMSLANVETSSTQLEPTQGPTPIPSPPPVYELEQGGYPEIEKFFQDYYVAKNCCDYEQIKSYVTDPNKIKSLEYMEVETQFLDDIRNITCYIMRSYEDGSYIVYVTYDNKYVNLKNTYPMLDKFYLITDNKGDLKIDTTEMGENLKTYYDDRDMDDKVKELYEAINQKQKEVLEKDDDLRIYLDALNNIFS